MAAVFLVFLGEVFGDCVHIHIHCGRVPSVFRNLKKIYAAKMQKNLAECKDVYDGLLTRSDPKPYYKDENFMTHFNEIKI